MMRVLDLFSAAAGGWSLGLHRAGLVTVAACEIVEWRRTLYAENNPDVRLYHDICDLTAARLLSDLGMLPDIIVGSPPCQDISSANTKGKGIEGERSGLYLEAIRLVGECRPRWFAFENSANLRTRGADQVLAAVEALGYACEPCVVAAEHVGANHVRKRSWLIGFDPVQLADTGIAITTGRDASGRRFGCAQGDETIGPVRSVSPTDIAEANGERWHGEWCGRRRGVNISAANDPGDTAQVGCGSQRQGRYSEPAAGSCEPPCRDDGNPDRQSGAARQRIAPAQGPDDIGSGPVRPDTDHERGAASGQQGDAARDAANTGQARQPDGQLESGLCAPQVPDHGCGNERGNDGSDYQPGAGQMGGCARIGSDIEEPWPDWNSGIAHHLRVDDGLSAWLAGTRIALGRGKGTLAASLIVEAFGDAVLPQIPEAIGRAILRTEAALDLALGRISTDMSGDNP